MKLLAVDLALARSPWSTPLGRRKAANNMVLRPGARRRSLLAFHPTVVDSFCRAMIGLQDLSILPQDSAGDDGTNSGDPSRLARRSDFSTACDDKSIHLWDVQNGADRKCHQHEGAAVHAGFFPGWRHARCGLRRPGRPLWDLATARCGIPCGMATFSHGSVLSP